MDNTVDRILEVIDAGLQSSPERAYGTDVQPDRCARCQRHERPSDGDLCTGCREFLLGDSDDDPARLAGGPSPHTDHVHLSYFQRSTLPGIDPEQMQVVLDVLIEQYTQVCKALGRAAKQFIDRVAPALAEIQRTIEDAIPEPEGEPAHRRRERELLGHHRRSHRRTNRWGPPPGRR